MPIDGSSQSYKALSHAVYIAQHNKAVLTLLHITDINHEVSDFERVSLSGYIPENIKDKGYDLLFKLLREIPPEIKTDICVEIGIPSEVIIEKLKTDNTISSSWAAAV